MPNMNLISLAKVAEDYPIALRTLRERLKDDPEFRATTLRVGRRIFVDRNALEQWFESKRQK